MGWKVGCVGTVGAVVLRGQVGKAWKEKLGVVSAALVVFVSDDGVRTVSRTAEFLCSSTPGVIGEADRLSHIRDGKGESIIRDGLGCE